MKFIAAVAVVASSCLVGLVSAQAGGLARLPRCAQACVGSSVTVPGCSGLDIRCICQNRDFLTNISCCVSKSCPAAEQQTTLEVAADFCRGAGVNLPVTQVTCPGASGSGSAASSTTAAATGAAASITSSAASAASSAASSASAAVSSFASSVSSAASSAASSASSAASSALVSTVGNAAPTAAPLAAHGLGLAGAAAVALALM